MAFINQMGRYCLQVKEANWATSDKGADYLFIRFSAESRWNGSAWDDSVAGLEISGYFYPLKANGERNRGFTMQMTRAFEWDGNDLETLKVTPGYWVQSDIDFDPSRNRALVKWLDHYTSTGEERGSKAVVADIKSVAAKFKAAKESVEMPELPARVQTTKPVLPARK